MDDSSYDVFLSFRTQDTRQTFPNHLYAALVRGNLRTFRGDYELVRDDFSRQLIQRSRICVILFSRNYAFSRYCLDELVCIMESWKTQDQLVLPVFNGIDPSEIRKQTDGVGWAIKEHYSSGKIEQTTIDKWREALTQAANLAGWVPGNKPFKWSESEANLIDTIVKFIHSKGLPARQNISIHPLRYDTCDVYLRVFLQAGSQDVLTVGICGPSQMGKTAMARVMYDRILHNFDGGCFLEDIAQKLDQINLKETPLYDIQSAERVIRISNASLVGQKLSSKRVLVVLDNVDDLSQINALIGDRGCFGPGSKFIITTRNVQLLEEFGVDQFILAQGRPLPQNVRAIWEPYQRSRCVVAGLKEYIDSVNQQRLRYLEAVLLNDQKKNAIQRKLISELLEVPGESSSSSACTVTKEAVTD